MIEQPVHPLLSLLFKSSVVQGVCKWHKPFTVIGTALQLSPCRQSQAAIRAEIARVNGLRVARESVALQLALGAQPTLGRTLPSGSALYGVADSGARFVTTAVGGRFVADGNPGALVLANSSPVGTTSRVWLALFHSNFAEA